MLPQWNWAFKLDNENRDARWLVWDLRLGGIGGHANQDTTFKAPVYNLLENLTTKFQILNEATRINLVTGLWQNTPNI